MPYRHRLVERLEHVRAYANRILDGQELVEFAHGHHHFGLHKTAQDWILREWAPAATKIYVIGEFSKWSDDEKYKMKRGKNGEWTLHLPLDALAHKDKYKLHVYWDGSDGYRVPAWATYVVQDEESKLFDAAVWAPKTPYEWRTDGVVPVDKPLIYEAHVGMATEEEKVGSYKEFARHVLPRIKNAGYNTVQLMAVAEHPYYGSFGYHVSSFFAPSSRFGTPDDLRYLIDTAHDMGIAVIIDLVHSHAVKNEVEGLGKYDGTRDQFFHGGERGEHEQWDSRVFNYGKPQVAHFLLSNCKYWIDEFRVDGFRFDGVTSMLYTHHGLGRAFGSYDDYFADVDFDAVAYLTLANRLIHDIKPEAITIAEDMSGMPGLAAAVEDGGMGFDYRLSMGMPDLWITYTKEVPDEDWNVSHLYHELTQHRPEEKTISYTESHDQALVGDKTLMFRMADKEMYDHMSVGDDNLAIDRAVALHKMIRLVTASLNGGGYLNFMGNEFGHPEWIDFPRVENDWSYKHARRQWSLVDNHRLKYRYVAKFDRAVMALLSLIEGSPQHILTHDDDHIMAYERGDFLFVFNFHPVTSFEDYSVSADKGNYAIVLSSDDEKFGGFDRVDTSMSYSTDSGRLRLYIPSRTALVLRRD